MEADPDVYANPFPVSEEAAMFRKGVDTSPKESVGPAIHPIPDDAPLNEIIKMETLREKVEHLFGKIATVTTKEGKQVQGKIVGCDPCARLGGGLDERCTPGDWLIVSLPSGEPQFVLLENLQLA